MHTLAAAQQVAGTASSSPPRASSACYLFCRSLPSSRTRPALSTAASRMESTIKAKPSSSSPKFLRLGTGLRILTRCLVIKPGSTLAPFLSVNGQDRSAKTDLSIRSFASRKDRREMDAGRESAKFEPDIASLRTGFSKKFPGEDPSGFRYEWESDDEDDGVQIKSFKGSNYGRTHSSTSSNSPRDGYRLAIGNKPDSLSRPGRPREEETGYERRKSQENGRQWTGSEDTRNRKGSRGEGDDGTYRTSGGGSWGQNVSSVREGATTGGSWKERGVVYGAGKLRTSGEIRGNVLPSRTLQDDDRNAGNGRNGPRKTSGVSRQVRRGREPYGGGEWSKDTPIFEDEKKKKPVIEPVNFTSAMSKTPHVAILGGGMSGLVCALTLEEHGIESTVFDTGKHGLGGRMATRHVEVHDGVQLVFDHAAQFFTVTDARFQKLVDRWISEGAVKVWSGNVGTLRTGGQYFELPVATRYIGTNGMRSLADHVLSQSRQITVKRPCWISNMGAVDGRWRLSENKKPQGEFDAVVIAHNGKCANRLLSTAHVPLIARQMKQLELSSVWALLAAFEEPLPIPGGKIVDGTFVDGVDSLSWMGNNSNKLLPPDGKTPQCWTFFSTAVYGKKNKVPQESIPTSKAHQVKQDMLRGVETALGLSEDSLPTPIYTRVQLWGAALPITTPDVPCMFDAHGRVGICGDWLVGSSLESAALSGMALADHIANYRDHGEQNREEFNVGLQQTFNVVKGHDIGQFPGTEELPIPSPRKALDVA